MAIFLSLQKYCPAGSRLGFLLDKTLRLKQIPDPSFVFDSEGYEDRYTLKALKTSGSAAKMLLLEDVLIENDDERALIFDFAC